MCGSSVPDQLSDTGASSGGGRQIGTKRRQLEWVTNFFLVIVSFFMISVGAALIGFYKLHVMQFISPVFFWIPIILVGKAVLGDEGC